MNTKARLSLVYPSLLAASLLATLVRPAAFSPLLAPHSPTTVSLSNPLQPPFWMEGGDTSHLLGADRFGRDFWSRLIYGSRTALTTAAAVVALSGTIGVALCILARRCGHRADATLAKALLIVQWATIGYGFCGASFLVVLPMTVIALVKARLNLNDLWNMLWKARIEPMSGLSAHFLYVWGVATMTLTILATLEHSVTAIVFILGLLLAPQFAHLFRSSYAADHGSLSRIVAVAMSVAILQAGVAILLESTLTFLGVGIPPLQPAWGAMAAHRISASAPPNLRWLALFPILAILLTASSSMLLAHWLRANCISNQTT